MALSIVTGANRGIGLAFVEALEKRGAQVLAACRASTHSVRATAAPSGTPTAKFCPGEAQQPKLVSTPENRQPMGRERLRLRENEMKPRLS